MLIFDENLKEIRVSKNKKVAVISGATGGMGSEIARKLASDGFELVLLGRNQNKLNDITATLKTTSDCNITNYCFDVCDSSAVAEFVETLKEQHSYISALVYAAGDGPVAKLSETTDEEWLNTFEVKLMGAVRLTRSMEQLLENGKGSVVIINGALTKQPHPLFPVNSAINCAVSGFAKSISSDLLPKGIRVNVVNPGATLTPLWETTARQVGDAFGIKAEDITRDVESKALYKRMTNPEDVANAVSFFTSSQSIHISGTSLIVDGGALSAL